jgi:hypothetical protein
MTAFACGLGRFDDLVTNAVITLITILGSTLALV